MQLIGGYLPCKKLRVEEHKQNMVAIDRVTRHATLRSKQRTDMDYLDYWKANFEGCCSCLACQDHRKGELVARAVCLLRSGVESWTCPLASCLTTNKEVILASSGVVRGLGFWMRACFKPRRGMSQGCAELCYFW